MHQRSSQWVNLFSRRPLDIRSVLLILAIWLLCTLLLLPLFGLLLTAFKGSQAGTLLHLGSTVLPRYIGNTFSLLAIVLLTVLVLGVGCAWITACFRFPGHRWFGWLLMLPLAVPSFVMAYAYTDFLDVFGPVQSLLRQVTGWEVGEYWFFQIRSITGAGFMLGFALYPYVYIVARQAFEDRSASAIEAAQTMGLSPLQVWAKVIFPMARPAIAAGATLVLMESVADFGAVSYFAVDTFTTGIYRAWLSMGDKAAAVQLALMLLATVGLLVWLERKQRKASQVYGRNTRLMPPMQLTGKKAALAFFACLFVVGLGFLLPVSVLLYAALKAQTSLDARLTTWIGNGVLLAGVSAICIIAVAIVLSYANRLLQSKFSRFVSALAQSGYAIPGLVIAVGLLAVVSFASNLGIPIGGTVLVLIFAYLVRFIAVGYQTIDAALLRISPSMDYSARSLGRGVVGVWRDVHWPLIRRSVLTGFLLVFVDCFKELQTTLVLRPLNFDTLVVVAYQFASDERLSEAAVPSLFIVIISAVPVLALWKAATKASAR
jgi:iron(III) transport system permease protein